jgi:hypothetical protein
MSISSGSPFESQEEADWFITRTAAYNATKECEVHFKDGTKKKYMITIKDVANPKILKECMAQIGTIMSEAKSREDFEKTLMEKVSKINLNAGGQIVELDIIPLNIVITMPSGVTRQLEKSDFNTRKVSVADIPKEADYHGGIASLEATDRLRLKKIYLMKIKRRRRAIDDIKKREKETNSALKKVDRELAKVSASDEKERGPLLKERVNLLFSKHEIIQQKIFHYGQLVGLYENRPNFSEPYQRPPSNEKTVAKLSAKRDAFLKELVDVQKEMKQLQEKGIQHSSIAEEAFKEVPGVINVPAKVTEVLQDLISGKHFFITLDPDHKSKFRIHTKTKTYEGICQQNGFFIKDNIFPSFEKIKENLLVNKIPLILDKRQPPPWESWPTFYDHEINPDEGEPLVPISMPPWHYCVCKSEIPGCITLAVMGEKEFLPPIELIPTDDGKFIFDGITYADVKGVLDAVQKQEGHAGPIEPFDVKKRLI